MLNNWNKKRRKVRIPFDEWRSMTLGHYNTGSIICENCNFHRTLNRGERTNNYQLTNKIDREHPCPNCNSNQHWYWLPPSARVPKKSANKRTWNVFWNKLKNRDFNCTGR